MANEEYDDEPVADPGAGLGNGMIILTTLVLVVAVYLIWSLNADLYNVGPLGG